MMKKTNRMASVALACAMLLAIPLSAGVAFADDNYFVAGYDHNGHAHAGYWTDAAGISSGNYLVSDPYYLTLSGAAKVYSSPYGEGNVVATLEAGEHVCYIGVYGDGWVHVYYNDGENAGWIKDTAL